MRFSILTQYSSADIVFILFLVMIAFYWLGFRLSLLQKNKNTLDGFGPVVSLGTNKGPGVDTFAIGPTFGAILKKGKFTYGFLNQNLFSFGGDIKVTQIQPILAYTLNKKVSFAIGDSQTTIDWNRKKLVAQPRSFQVNYIALLGKQPIRLFINPQYSPINNFGQRKWTIGGGFALIIP